MVRTINDFAEQWRYEQESTLKIFNSLTDESLEQKIPGGRTLGRLANHITETLTELPHKCGLPIAEEYVTYKTVPELVAAYQRVSDQLLNAVTGNWHDNMLQDEQMMYGEPWKNGFSLFAIIAHQAHHRGQMTVLMRLAGLQVPGMYGPSKEEWQAMHMQPLD